MAEVANPSEQGCQVVFQPIGRRSTVPAGTTLLEAGRRAGLLLSAACGGVGVCGKCMVTVVSGEMFPPEHEEQNFLARNHHPANSRLACEARVASSVVVALPASFRLEQRLQLDGESTLTHHQPLVASHTLHIAPPTLADSRSDFARIAQSLTDELGPREWHMHPAVAAQFPTLTGGDASQLTAYTRHSEIIGFAPPNCPPLGLAVDVGCTKIASYLLDLSTGTQLAAAGAPNPQITYGEDLISRLVYAAKAPDHAHTLAACIRQTIATLAQQLCHSASVSTSRIADACIVGNTAMMHLLLELPVARLLHAPFVASVDRDIDLPARELGWHFAPSASVHILPSIGGFVGADHVAMILARGIERSERITLGLDIGTNTEICIHHPQTGKLLTTSVPSGPVFEGAHIADGMRAASGAIDKVFLHGPDLAFSTLDSAQPVGICGSGILDLVFQLRRLGVINPRGHLVRSDHRVRTGPCGPEFVVAPASLTAHGRDITLTQHDVTQVQLAKAAISAGIQTLLHVAGITPDQVEEVDVAGAFGSYLDLRSAIGIGLLPLLPNAEYKQVGNAAGAGAKMALLSTQQRERARRIARHATKVELKQHASFDRAMAHATQFPPVLSESASASTHCD